MKSKTSSEAVSQAVMLAEIRGVLAGNENVLAMLRQQANSEEPFARHRARVLLSGVDSSSFYKEIASRTFSHGDVFEKHLRAEAERFLHFGSLRSLNALPKITFEELFLRRRLLNRPAVNNPWDAASWDALTCNQSIWHWIWVTVTKLDYLLFRPGFWTDLVRTSEAYHVRKLREMELALASMIVALNSGLIVCPLPSWEERVQFLSWVGNLMPKLTEEFTFGEPLVWPAFTKVLGILDLPQGQPVSLPAVPEGILKHDRKNGAWILGRALMPFDAVQKGSNSEECQEWISGVAANVRVSTVGADILRWRNPQTDAFTRWALEHAWYGKSFAEHPEWLLELARLGIVSEYDYFEAISCDVPGMKREPFPSLAVADVARVKILRRRALDAKKHEARKEK